MAIFNEDFYYYDDNTNSDFFHLHSYGKLYPDKRYIVSRQKNDDVIIECILDGVGYIEYNGIVTTLEKGDCYIITPGRGHAYYTDDNNPYSKIWINVSGKIVMDWLRLYGLDKPINIRVLDITQYYNLIKHIVGGAFNLDNDKKLMLAVHDIIFEMAIAPQKQSSLKKFDTHYVKTTDNVVLDIKKYLEKNCNERIKIKDVATKFGISTVMLNKEFTGRFDISPYQYHLKCKLESACYFLMYTDLSIDMVSETTGFCDRSHFRKLFEKEYGLTPSLYRKKNQQ